MHGGYKKKKRTVLNIDLARSDMGSRSESNSELRSWSDLPDELLEIISKFLKTKIEVFRFRAICKSWRISSNIHRFNDPSPLPHTLKIKTRVAWSSLIYRWVVIETKLYHVAPYNNSSSSRSWLLKLKEIEHGRFLISDPFSSMPSSSFIYNNNNLPRVINSLDFRVCELCTLSYTINLSFKIDDNRKKYFNIIFPSNLKDCPNSLLLISGLDRSVSGLFIKRDKHWTRRFHVNRFLCDNADIISYGGKFCILYKNGRAITVDSVNSSLKEEKEIEIAYALPIQHRETCENINYDYHHDHDKHLVDLYNGELLLVDICAHGTYNNSRNCIKVFKLNVKEKKWVEVKSLDGRILFIGWDYISFSVFADDFPGCKPNCVCIASYGGPLVYDLVDASFLPPERILHYTNLFLPPWNRASNGERHFIGEEG